MATLTSDIYEDNNTFETATDISGEGQDFYIEDLTIDSSGDVDYFSFNLDSTGAPGWNISLYSSDDTDLDLFLYDSTETLVGSSDYEGTDEVILLNGLGAGAYYLKVEGSVGATGTYEIDMDGPAGDDAEPNESLGAPLDLSSLFDPSIEYYFTGYSIHASDDQDFYKVDLAQDSHIGIVGYEDAGDLDLYIFDESGNQIASSTSDGPDEQILLTSLSAGSYIINVQGIDGALGTYDWYYAPLETNEENIVAAITDQEWIDTAKAIFNTSESETFTYYINLEDDIAFTDDTTDTTARSLGHYEGYIESVFEGIDAIIDLDFYRVYDNEASAIDLFLVDSVDPNDPDTTGYASPLDTHWEIVLQDGLDESYQIGNIIHEIGHVLGLSHPNGDGPDYRFTVDQTVVSYNEGVNGWSDSFSAADIALLKQIWGEENDTSTGGGNSSPGGGSSGSYEDNNTFETATDISGEGQDFYIEDLTIDSSGDVDYFSFNLDSTGAPGWNISLYSSDDTDLDLFLYDSTETLVGSSDYEGTDEVILLNGLGAGAYYLKVEGSVGATGTYEIDMDGPAGDDAEPNESLGAPLDLSSLFDPSIEYYFTGYSIHASDDQDFYKVDLAQDSHIGIVGYEDAGDLDLYIFDESGNQIASSTSDGPDEQILLTSLSAGSYIINVQGIDGALGTYDWYYAPLETNEENIVAAITDQEWIDTAKAIFNTSESETFTYYINLEDDIAFTDDTTDTTARSLGHYEGYIESVFEGIDAIIDLDFYRVYDNEASAIDLFLVDSVDPNDPDTTGYASPLDTHWEIVLQDGLDESYQIGNIIHEIGHVLGLSHPNGDGPDYRFTVDQTVVSYNEGVNGWSDSFSAADIALLKQIWGEENDTSTGGGNSSPGGGSSGSSVGGGGGSSSGGSGGSGGGPGNVSIPNQAASTSPTSTPTTPAAPAATSPSTVDTSVDSIGGGGGRVAESTVLGIQPQETVTTIELTTPLTLGDLQVTQAVVGTPQRDVITGSDAGEALAGGEGKDQMTGGGGPDAFLFETPGEFGKKSRDTVTDFNPDEGDKVVLAQDVFDGVKKIKLDVASGKKDAKNAASSKKNFIYDEKKGILYFNENGKKNGWGDGGEFVKLLGAPELGSGDLAIV